MKRDLIAQAQSGSGKTATFTIGLLQRIDVEDISVQAMVLAPTRELAKQICGVVKKLGHYMKIKVELLTGGTRVRDNKE